MKTKLVTISLTKEHQEKARLIAKEVIGQNNISGLFAFWINQFQLSCVNGQPNDGNKEV